MANEHLLAAQICIQSRVPVFLWGGPGIGKTAVLEAIATALKEPIWTVILSIREPSDQGGLPVIRPDGVTMHPPMWAKQLNDKGYGVVFWDEFNTAPPTTQSSALRVIHGGYAGDLKLPENTSHVAAGNPATMVSGGYDLTAAIANRWTHIDWPTDVNAWAEGMVQGWPEPQIVRLPLGWRDGISAKRGLVAAFIRRRTDLHYVLPKNAAEQGRAWPSPRTWDRIATLLAASNAAGYSDKSAVARLLIVGCVGEAAAAEWSAWIANLDLRDPEEYLADPMLELPKRQDQVMATLDSVAAAALNRGRKDALQRYYTAWTVLGRVLEDRGDIAIPACRTLANAISNDPFKGVRKNLPPEIEKILPLLEKAGIDFSQNA